MVGIFGREINFKIPEVRMVGEVVARRVAGILPIVALASQVKIEHLLTYPEMAAVGLGLVGAWAGSRFFGNFIENRVDSSLIDTKRGRVRRGVIDSVDVDTSRLGYNFGRVMAKVLTSDQLWEEPTGQRKLFKELWLSKGPHDNQAHFAKTMLNLIHGLRRIERKSGEDVAGLMLNVEYRQKVADLVGLCEILGEVRLVAGKGVQDWYRYGLGKGSDRLAFMKGAITTGALIGLGVGKAISNTPEMKAAGQVIDKRELVEVEWYEVPEKKYQELFKQAIEANYPDLDHESRAIIEKIIMEENGPVFFQLSPGRYYQADLSSGAVSSGQYEQYLKEYFNKAMSRGRERGLDPVLWLQLMRMGEVRTRDNFTYDLDVVEAKMQAVLGSGVGLVERILHEKLDYDLDLSTILRGIVANPKGHGVLPMQRLLGPETGGIFDIEALMTARSIKQLDKNDPIWAGVGITVETEIEDLVAMDTSREKLKEELNDRVMEFVINDESLVATFLEQADGSNWNEIGLGDDPSAGDILHQIGRNSEVYRLWLKKWNLDKENFSRELIVESIKDYRVSLQAETQVEGGKVSAMRRLIVGQMSNQKFISWMETHVDQKNRPKWDAIVASKQRLERSSAEFVVKQRQLFADLGSFEYNSDFQLDAAAAYASYLGDMRDKIVGELEIQMYDPTGISLKNLVEKNKHWDRFTKILLREVAPPADVTCVSLNTTIVEAGVDPPYNYPETLYWLNKLVNELGKMGYSDKTELESNQLLSAIVRFRGLYERNEVDKLSQTLNPKQLQVLTPIFDHMDWDLYSSYFEAHKYFEKTNAG